MKSLVFGKLFGAGKDAFYLALDALLYPFLLFLFSPLFIDELGLDVYGIWAYGNSIVALGSLNELRPEQVGEKQAASPIDLKISLADKTDKKNVSKNVDAGNKKQLKKTDVEQGAAKKSKRGKPETSGELAKSQGKPVFDGNMVPEIRNLNISAIAYSDEPSSRLVVLNQNIMRQGDMIGRVKLLLILREELIFLLGKNRYRLVFRSNDENN